MSLYNQYISGNIAYEPIPAEEDDHQPQEETSHTSSSHSHKSEGFWSLFGAKGTEKNAGLSGILKKLKLDELDMGDLLLLLILFLVLKEGGNWELAIILGLVFLLGMGSDED